MSAPLHPPHGRAEIEAMFGNPTLPDGTLDPKWERKNIVLVEPPDGWRLRYQATTKLIVPSSGIRMHRRIVEPFLGAMHDVWEIARTDWPTDPLAWLRDQRLDLHGGGYNFRPIAGGRALSLHAYGIAIDFDPLHNARGSATWSLPDWWFAVWTANGWTDGRRFPVSDPMHLQFASGA